MKNLNIIYALLLAAIGGSSCSKDYVEPEFKTKSFSMYSSFYNHSSGGANINPTYLNTNELQGVMDLSQGQLSHEWSYWSGSEFADAATGERTWERMSDGITFIKSNSGLGWGTLDDYTPYLDPSINPTNSKQTLTYLFDKPGAYKIRIRNTYDVPIRYMYNIVDPLNTSNRVNEYIDSVPLADGTYEVIREYETLVYADLVGSVKVYSDADYTNEVDMSQKVEIDNVITSEIIINDGDTLYFHDATGENNNGVSTIFTAPSSRSWAWVCTQADDDPDSENPTVTPTTSTNQKQPFTFQGTGVFEVILKVERADTYGVGTHYPTASATYYVPLIVYVK